MKQDLQNRLAALRVEIDETTAQRQIAVIAAELLDPRPPVRAARRRIRIAALAAAAVLIALPATAVAAESAVPGDLLYPVKRATEAVRSLIDPNIEAEHRIDELEIVIERNAPEDEIQRRLTEAEEAVRESDIPADLSDRLDGVRDQLRDRSREQERQPPDTREPTPRQDEGSDRQPPVSPTTTTIPASDSTVPVSEPPSDQDRTRGGTTTTPPESDRPRHGTSTTTEPPRGSDRPPRDG